MELEYERFSFSFMNSNLFYNSYDYHLGGFSLNYPFNSATNIEQFLTKTKYN